MAGKSAEPAITPPATLSAASAATFRAELEAARGGNATLDLSGVEMLGGLCLELVIAAQATWRAEGLTLTLADPSAAFLNDAATLGALRALGLETERASA